MSPAEMFEAQPSNEEIEQARLVLSRLQPGLLPIGIFLETARLCTTPVLEIVPVRNRNDTTEVLLLRRDDNDPNWPSQMHTPGTVIRSTDVGNGLASPMARIMDEELQVQTPTPPQFVGTLLHEQNRGTEFATIMYVDMTGVSTPVGEWHSADNLPTDIVETQRSFINQAVESYERNKQA